MQHFLYFCQTYSGAIQAFATVVLIGITGYYAHITHQSLKVARDQLDANLVPQISVKYETPSSSVSPSMARLVVVINLSNAGAYPFTIIRAEAWVYATYESTAPAATIELEGLRKRVVGSHDGARETVDFTVLRTSANAPLQWKMELRMLVHDAIRSNEYQYWYDNVHGMREQSRHRFSLRPKLRRFFRSKGTSKTHQSS